MSLLVLVLNGRLSDLEVVAKIVKGKKVHPNIKAVIVPGSQNS